MRRLLLIAALTALALVGCAGTPPPAPAVTPVKPVRVGLALAGGAARGFANVGVIKVLESQGRKYAAAPARTTNGKARAAALAASLPSGENTKAGKARAKAKARAEAKAKAAR